MSVEQFIKKLQTADEPRKRRWLVLSTAIVMVIVIFVWLRYFNSLVQPDAAAISPSPVSFWGTMGHGVVAIYHAFTNSIRALGGMLVAPQTYIVKPTN